MCWCFSMTGPPEVFNFQTSLAWAQAFINHRLGIPTEALFPMEASTHGFLLKKNCDCLYLPVYLSNSGGSGLPYTHTHTNDNLYHFSLVFLHQYFFFSFVPYFQNSSSETCLIGGLILFTFFTSESIWIYFVNCSVFYICYNIFSSSTSFFS